MFMGIHACVGMMCEFAFRDSDSGQTPIQVSELTWIVQCVKVDSGGNDRDAQGNPASPR